MNTLVVILGPTGVGKTELCLHIAKYYNIPIINADSRQIFSEIPIGTAAPSLQQQKNIKHYFVGTHHVSDYYCAAMYEEDALKLLNNLFSKQTLSPRIQLVTGGSMMYLEALCNGIDNIPTIDESTREMMKKRLETEGLEQLVQELKILDPEHYEIVDKNNPRRVVHALEICHMTGKTYTSFRTNTKKTRPFNIIKIGLNRDREEMYNRINHRVLLMMEKGLEEEAKKMYPMRNLNALNTVGYKELFDYFDGKYDRDEAIRRIQSNTRRYMRKQLTWFKKDKSIFWTHPSNIKEIINYIDNNIQ